MGDFVVRTSSNTSLAFLTLDGSDRLAAGAWTSAIRVYGSDSHVHDVELVNVRVGTGVYFQDVGSARNRFVRVHVHHCYYGIIFADGLDSKHANTFQDGLVEDIACDAVTFAGFGRLIGSIVRNAGAGCVLDSEPIPGAGLRCHGNIAGG